MASAEPTNPNERSKDFLGVGWSFPLRLGIDGEFSMSEFEQDVREAILIILQTNPGERVMRPEFGAGLRAFVFQPISASSQERLRQRVRDALVDWEPRIDVLNVQVDSRDARLGTLRISIDYRVRASNNVHNLVFPFYLKEGAQP